MMSKVQNNGSAADSDSDWEAVGTPTPPESPPLLAQQTKRTTVKFDEAQQATHHRLRDAKSKRSMSATDLTNDAKVQQLMDEFESLAASKHAYDDKFEAALAALKVSSFSKDVTQEEKTRQKNKEFAKASLDPAASIHASPIDLDDAPEVAPLPQKPVNAKYEGEMKDSAPQSDCAQNNLTGKMRICAWFSVLAIMTVLTMISMLKTAPPVGTERSARFVILLMLLGIKGLLLFELGTAVVAISQHPVFREKVASAWQALRDSLQEEDEEDEEELTEGDKQLRQASQIVAGSLILPALAVLGMVSISPWYRIIVPRFLMKVVVGVLVSIWIFAFSRVDWKDTTMARDITTFIERWMPVQPVIDPNTAADQPKQDLSLGLKMMQLSDEFVTFVLDMILKAILAATIGYIVLHVQTFDEVCGNRVYMSVSTVLMVKTPRLPLFEQAADGLIWAWDRLQPHAARLTAAVRQRIARSGKYINDNKQIWIANGKRFGKMAGDALLWTLNLAGRIVLASIFLHAVLLCLHGYQSRQSVEVQQETPVASGVADVANIQALPLARLNKWSDVVSLALQKMDAQSEHSEGRNKVIACPFGRGYPTGEQDDTDPEPHIEQEPTAEEPQQPEPSGLGSKEHIIELTSWNGWLQKYLDDINGLMEEYDSLSEKLAPEMRE